MNDHVGVSLFLHLVRKLLCFCIQCKCIYVLVFSVGATLYMFFPRILVLAVCMLSVLVLNFNSLLLSPSFRRNVARNTSSSGLTKLLVLDFRRTRCPPFTISNSAQRFSDQCTALLL